MTIYITHDSFNDGIGNQLCRKIVNYIIIKTLQKNNKNIDIQYIHTPFYWIGHPFGKIPLLSKKINIIDELNNLNIDPKKKIRFLNQYEQKTYEAKILNDFLNIHKYEKTPNDINIQNLNIIHGDKINIHDVPNNSYLIDCRFKVHLTYDNLLEKTIIPNLSFYNEYSNFFNNKNRNIIINFHIRGGDLFSLPSNHKDKKRLYDKSYFINILKIITNVLPQKIINKKFTINIHTQKINFDETPFKNIYNDINFFYENNNVNINSIEYDLNCIKQLILCDYFVPSDSGFSNTVALLTKANIIYDNLFPINKIICKNKIHINNL